MFAIVGVSGNTGKIVAEALLGQGKKVRVIVRDAAKGKEWEAKGASVAVADLGDEALLTKALEGAEGAYLLIPPNFAAPDFRAYQAATAKAIAGAVRASRVPRVVFLSSIGAELPSGTGPIAGLHGAEKLLREVGTTKTTFLRAGYFAENLGASLSALGQGILPSFFPSDFKLDMIATRDIGETAARLLVEGARETSIVNLAGPPTSMSDVAKDLSQLTGKDVVVQVAPTSAMVPALTGFGVPAGMAALYQEMTEALLRGTIQWEKGHAQLQGKTTVREVLRPHLAS